MKTLFAFAVSGFVLASAASAHAQQPPPPPSPDQPLPALPTADAPAGGSPQAAPPPPPAPYPPSPYAYPPGHYPPPAYYGYGYGGYGQGQGPAAYAPPPPPPPGPPPGYHLHDGFFLRMGLGFGALSDETTLDGASSKVTTKGGGANIDLAIGGALGDGFILAGSLVGMVVSEPTVEAAGYSAKMSNTSVSLSTLGLLGDWYTDPSGGFHVGALLGIASLSAQRDTTRSSDDAETELGRGIALAAHVGYEGWVGADWALGGMFRLLYAGLSAESDGKTWHDKVFVPTLSFTATYN